MLHDDSESIILFLFISLVMIFVYLEYNSCFTMEHEYKKIDVNPVKDSRYSQSFCRDRESLLPIAEDVV